MSPAHRRRNHDGGVWRITGARTASGYRAWVAKYPDVAAEGGTWQETEERILRAISEQLQAGEWTADWDPARPAAPGLPYAANGEYVILVGDASFTIAGEHREYFAGEPCGVCRRPLGERNAAPLRVRVDGLAGIMFCAYQSPVQSLSDVYRRSTVEALGPKRMPGAIVRAVKREGSGRVELVEVEPPSNAIDAIAVRGMELNGRRCAGCRTPYFWHHLGGGDYIDVYPRDAVPVGAEAFWVRGSGSTDLCVRASWWREHRGDVAFRSVIARGLYVAEAADIDPEPPLPLK